tara:strand:- start:187 stop:483 length:297 start_codon:yes stop_codon:yes gene_type:complete
MNLEFIFLIFGFIGSGIASIMMIPQVYLTIKTKKTDDLSLNMISLNLLAILFFLPYSLYYNLYPYIVTNSSLLVCNSILFYYKLKNELATLANNIPIE